MDPKRFLRFVAKVVAAQVTFYFLAGLIFYPLLTKPYYEGPNPIFAVFLITETDTNLWPHVVNWFLPIEILRGVLIAAVLYPLYDTLKAWAFLKRFFCVASLLLVLGFWASAAAAPGTLEGMLYLRPFITPVVHLRVQPENILQALGVALLVAGAMMERAGVEG
jgi:phosphoglycerol transferase MdoB-like AlkP superfamily enzyme